MSSLSVVNLGSISADPCVVGTSLIPVYEIPFTYSAYGISGNYVISEDLVLESEYPDKDSIYQVFKSHKFPIYSASCAGDAIEIARRLSLSIDLDNFINS